MVGLLKPTVEDEHLMSAVSMISSLSQWQRNRWSWFDDRTEAPLEATVQLSSILWHSAETLVYPQHRRWFSQSTVLVFVLALNSEQNSSWSCAVSG